MMTQGAIDRAYWIQTLRRICDPVLINLKNRTLRQKMPVEQMEGRCRVPYTYLEAFGPRPLAGEQKPPGGGGIPAPEVRTALPGGHRCRNRPPIPGFDGLYQ